MFELSIELHWQRSEPNLQSGKFSNAHTVRYNDSYDLQVDAAPDWGGNIFFNTASLRSFGYFNLTSVRPITDYLEWGRSKTTTRLTDRGWGQSRGVYLQL